MIEHVRQELGGSGDAGSISDEVKSSMPSLADERKEKEDPAIRMISTLSLEKE